MQKGKVSVIIPNFNYARYIAGAVESVLTQTYPEIEVIVVDDGSTDTSRDILMNYGDSIKAVFQQNQGVSAARNNGARDHAGLPGAKLYAGSWSHWITDSARPVATGRAE